MLDEINRINTDDKENDIIGRVYEYFFKVSSRLLQKEKVKGEFYTKVQYCNLIAEMLEPYDGDMTLVVVVEVCLSNQLSL